MELKNPFFGPGQEERKKTMIKQTEHAEKLERMYSLENGRVQGIGRWAKFPLFWFHLFMSYKCTRRCEYCYAFNQVGDEDPLEMDEKTFSRLLEWIPEVWKVNNIKVNSVIFLGGEPLLRTDRIRKVMDSVFERTDGMQASLYTNGDLVDSVHWGDLEDIQYMITNAADTPIEELSRRMKVIGERSNVIGQTVVATLDDFNLERLLELSKFGVENGYRLRYQRDMFRGSDPAYRARLLKRYHELCDLLEECILRGYDVKTTFLLDFLIPEWEIESSPYGCGRRLVTVHPDGTVTSCIREHSHRSGTIFDPDPLKAIRCSLYYYDVSEPDIPEECGQCEFKTVCQGGCPHDKLLLSGTRAGKSVLCEIHREIIPRLRHLRKLRRERVSSGCAGVL